MPIHPLFHLFLLAASASALRIDIGPLAQLEGHGILSFALPDLLAAASSAPSAASASVTFELSPSFRASTGAAAESCVHSSPTSTSASITCSGLLGLAYSLHDLREALLLNRTSIGSLVQALGSGPLRSPPSYSLRSWSEEGQLLDLPDRAYYLPDGSAADTAALAAECAALEAEVVPALLRLRMNALIVLHSDIEDYVTYDTLPQRLPGSPAIYPAASPHRARRAGIVAVMAPWIARLRALYGLEFFFQVYELSSPPGVCTAAAAAPPLLNCSLASPATAALLATKYSELAAALPALAGIFVTVEDSWTPRASYQFSVLWSAQPQLPAVVTLFHAALAEAHLRLVFRLWVFGEPVDWANLIAHSPPDVEFSIKQTQGDFLLDYPLNTLLQCTPQQCPPKDRRVIVEVDAFRQYNGWTSGVCYMGEQWVPRLAQARAAGVADVWGWGSWAPGCTWPDSGPSLLNHSDAQGPKSWRGAWDSYRVFNATPSNGGFALGAQANAYLLSRLSWDAAPNASAIALDFGALYYGAANAPAVAALLAASLQAWLPTSSPASVGDFTLFWTMLQHDVGAFARLAASGATLAAFEAAAAASAAAVGDMQAALAAISPASIPASNPQGWAGAARAVGVSGGYLQALFAWRSTGLRVALLGPHPTATACGAALAAIADMAAKVGAFDAAFPIESASWVVGRLDPALQSYPPFLQSSERTMAAFAPRWRAQVAAVCPGGEGA
jgi:hypothetical protein